ncbi:MAG: hypothetical protein QF615_13585, partial [Planctomycetota bacterium]|nr:hypothetical protein [Planctomycetota bacterium]
MSRRAYRRSYNRTEIGKSRDGGFNLYHPDAALTGEERLVTVTPTSGPEITFQVDGQGQIVMSSHHALKGHPIDAIVGDALGKRILKEASGRLDTAKHKVRVGSRGLITQYDKLMVQAANKLMKQFAETTLFGREDIRARKVSVPSIDEGEEIWVLELPERVHTYIKEHGFTTFAPKFAAAAPGEPGEAPALKGIQDEYRRSGRVAPTSLPMVLAVPPDDDFQARFAATPPAEGSVGEREELLGARAIRGTGPHGRILVRDVARATVRRKADPSNRRSFKRAVLRAAEEARFQLQQVDSGADWYRQDIGEALEITAEVYPELLTDTSLKQVLLAFAAITSNGQKPTQNWADAAYLYGEWRRTGRVPRRRANGALFGTKGQTIGVGLGLLQHMLDTHGAAGAARWLLSPKTVGELRDMRRESRLNPAAADRSILRGGIYSDTRGMSVDGRASDEAVGSYVFGPKVGPFFLNVNGVDDTTIDRWAMRTFGRHFGRIFSGSLSDEGVHDAPTAAERPLAKDFFREIGRELGVPAQEAQALLWFFEQQSYTVLGQRAASERFSEAAERWRIKLGDVGRPGAPAPEAGPVGGLFAAAPPGMAIDLGEVEQAIRDKGGITVNVWSSIQPAVGYSVAPFKETQVAIEQGDFNEDRLEEFLVKWRPLLEVGGMHYGAWVEKGVIIQDASVVVEDRLLAAAIGEYGEQDAIFDLAGFKDIYAHQLRSIYGKQLNRAVEEHAASPLAASFEQTARGIIRSVQEAREGPGPRPGAFRAAAAPDYVEGKGFRPAAAPAEGSAEYEALVSRMDPVLKEGDRHIDLFHGTLNAGFVDFKSGDEEVYGLIFASF